MRQRRPSSSLSAISSVRPFTERVTEAADRAHRQPTDTPEGRRYVTFEEALDVAVRLFETAGVGILVLGGLVSVVAYARDLLDGRDRKLAYTALRHNLGRTILLGLEVLIVADIILTVAIDQTLESAATLGLIVLVRTFLSFSLDIEMDGVVPWRRRASEGPPGS